MQCWKHLYYICNQKTMQLAAPGFRVERGGREQTLHRNEGAKIVNQLAKTNEHNLEVNIADYKHALTFSHPRNPTKVPMSTWQYSKSIQDKSR